MCSEQTFAMSQDTQQPAYPGGAPPTVDTGDGGLGQTLATADANAKKTLNVTGPTKFGSLVKFLMPVLEGGLAGWAGGKGHAQGGFGAANDFFQQRRQQQLQQAVLQQQMQSAAADNLLRMARANYYNGRTPGASSAPANPVDMPLRAGQLPSDAPPDLDAATVSGRTGSASSGPFSSGKSQLRETNRGLMDVTGDTAKPVMGRIPRLPSWHDSGTPTLGGVPVGGQSVPLGPNVTTRPSGWRNEAEEDAALEYKTKHPDASSAEVLRYVSGLTRKPEKDDSQMSGREYRTRQAELLTKLNQEFRDIEKSRQRQIEQAGGEFASDDDVKEINLDAADAKQEMHQRLIDQASAEGIDIGKLSPGFYRAQLTGKTPGMPTTPPSNTSGRGSSRLAPASTSAGGKTAPFAAVRAWAQKNGISETTSLKQFRNRGYSVPDAPQ